PAGPRRLRRRPRSVGAGGPLRRRARRRREPPDARLLRHAGPVSGRGRPRTVALGAAPESLRRVLLGPARHPVRLPPDSGGGLDRDARVGPPGAGRRRPRVRAAARLARGGRVSAASPAIDVREASKVYRRYARPAHGTLKSALLGGGHRRSREGGVVALEDVSFSVAPGETLGVIGANGSGKSTLLKLLAGIVRPTRGSVAVRGRLAALLELGAGFHPEISGRENIEITGLLLGLTRREIADRFDAVVRFAGVEEFLDAPVKTYSSGMAVRLGFAIAAHSDPDVLLVDEVLAV